MHAAAAAVVNGPPPPQHMVGPPSAGPDPRARDYPLPPPPGVLMDNPGGHHHSLPPPQHLHHVLPPHVHVHPGPPPQGPAMAYGPPPPGFAQHQHHTMAPISGLADHTDLEALLRSGRQDEWNAPRAIRRPSEIPVIRELDKADHDTWCQIGAMAEQLSDLDRAMECYQKALRYDPESKRAFSQLGAIARAKEDFPMAVDYLSRVLSLDQQNGELWSALGHCYLMLDVLPKAYSSYQQALYCLASPTNVKLWYGIGILYDRYGSLEHAEEAFTSVLRMEEGKPSSFNTNEVYFRLGVIYKQQHKHDQSLECFQRIAEDPPQPLRPSDILFQIGHVYEQKGDYDRARSAYERVLLDVPNHAKVLQELGWLFFQSHTSFHSIDNAIECLTRSLGAGSLNDESDAQSWYLLGRAYMAAEKYNKAYEAYQQAVYRDGRNPTFWCSIGVLYYQIQQFRDALDAYSRAIRINPYISEVWFDLGCLYESCNNQISDAIDAYKRALELDTENQGIKDRLRLLEDHKSSGGPPPPPPPVQDVHPTAYASMQGQLGPPNSLGLPLSLGVPSPRYPVHGGTALPPIMSGPGMAPPGHRINSPSYGQVEMYRQPHMANAENSRTGMALAPMDIDRAGPPPAHASALPSMPLEPPYGRPPQSAGEMHPLQQAQMQHPAPQPSRGPYEQQPQQRMEQHRPPPRVSPPVRTHSAAHHQHSGSYSSHHALLNPSTPPAHPQQSPQYPPPQGYRPPPSERDHPPAWDQRGPPSARPGYDIPRPVYDTPAPPGMRDREREREREGRESELSTPYRGYDSRRPPSPRDMRRPEVRPPVVQQQQQQQAQQQPEPGWQSGPPMPQQPVLPPMPTPTAQTKRYDPLHDSAEDARRREAERREAPPPDRMDVDRMPPPRVVVKQEPRTVLSVTAETDSRMDTASPPLKEDKKRKSRGVKDNESDTGSQKRPRRSNPRSKKEENGSSPAPSRMRSRQKDSPGSNPSSNSNGRRASRASATPSSTAPPPAPVLSRVVNEDYDEGVAETLMNLSKPRHDPIISPTRSEHGVPVMNHTPVGPPLPPAPLPLPVHAPAPVLAGPLPPMISPPHRPVKNSPTASIHGPERPPPVSSPAYSLPERNSKQFGPSPPPPHRMSISSMPSSKPQSPLGTRTTPSSVQSPPGAAVPPPVFHGPPRPPEMVGAELTRSIPPSTSPVAVVSPTTSRTETPNGPSNPRKRPTPPSPIPDFGMKRQRLDVPSPPRAAEPAPTPTPVALAAIAPPSPPRSPPPIATLQDVSSPESTRSRSPGDPSDQLMDSRNSPAVPPVSPPTDVAKAAAAPAMERVVLKAVDVTGPTKAATSDPPEEDSPMDMGE
ncbi:hypothetical protein DACRYDRAFT_24125 [Dacryopinax primogenitus]|uniref:Uncharacterized protein n=1 Tax=Dacryopinax primogenitus (strain DJM 731) TaxID=1858805 RepID=M5FQA4_DACPD|nr:uncharacterized protein DACRYDRAFT_24125 [Dacryopinax primogenitus]EJT99045.1 hypothetical protein DACRYDRAFT_24125 [Dacryopinax primogenitus]